MNPATIASSDWKYAMVCDTPYLKNEFGDPRFFLRFLSNFVIFHLQSFKKFCTWELSGANVLEIYGRS